MFNKKEIDNIAQLLLSTESNNKQVALSIIESKPAVIPHLLIPLEIYLAYHKEDHHTATLFNYALPDYQLHQSGIYAFYAEKALLSEDKRILDAFVKNKDLYEKWLMQDAQKANAYSYFAYILASKHKDMLQAKELYQRLLKYFPDNALHHYDYARSLQMFEPNKTQEICQSILDSYHKSYALKANIDTALALSEFHKIHFQSLPDAIEVLLKAKSDFPDAEDLYTQLSYLYYEQQQWQKALDTAHTCIDLLVQKNSYFFEREEILLLLGLIYQNGFKNPQKAIDMYENVLDCNPQNQRALKTLVTLYEDEKNYDKAIEILNQQLEEQEFNIHYRMHLGNLYLLTNATHLAKEQFEQVLEIVPKYSPASDALQQLLDE